MFLILFVEQPYFLIAAALLILSDFALDMTNPIQQTYMHKNIKTTIRATVLSSKSMILASVTVLVRLVGGALMDLYGPQTVIAFGGIGIAPPGAAWGAMVNDGYFYLLTRPVLSFAPGLAIVIVVFAFNMVGDGLRDALDPKLRGVL